MNTSNLTTRTAYNPYILNGKVIEKLFFFQSGKIITSVRWFGSNNEYPTLTIPADIKRKNSIDLESKLPFFTTIKDGYDKGNINLYIPANIVDLKDLGEFVYFDNEHETQYQQKYSITVDCSKWQMQLKAGYKKTDYQAYGYVVLPIEKRVIEFLTFTRVEKKQKFYADKKLQDDIKEICNVNIDLDDIQRILKSYNITKIS